MKVIHRAADSLSLLRGQRPRLVVTQFGLVRALLIDHIGRLPSAVNEPGSTDLEGRREMSEVYLGGESAWRR